MERWSGKTVVITGASSGIGHNLVIRLANCGMRVVALARREDRLKALEGEKTKGTIKGLKCDVSKEDEVKEAFRWIEENMGEVHVLVNNAGILQQNIINNLDITKVSETLNINIIGCLTTWKYFLASVQKHKTEFAHAFFMNSTAGHEVVPIPGIAPYCVSKHALKVFTKSIRNELSLIKSKIRVTSIHPGLVESEMSDQFRDKFVKDTPILKADDIADCVVFVLGAPPNVNISELTVQSTTETVISSVAKYLKNVNI